MVQTVRPLSPHLSIYRWQIQMVTSILHRATGLFLALGSVLVCLGLLALASGPDAYATLHAFCASWVGLLLLIGWSWSFSFHLLNGIRHLLQDIGWGYRIDQFVLNGWLATVGSVVLTALVWICALRSGGAL
ncbi:MAG TPA: succinate dehydrogenase, cytochrome b556 subunit [Rhodanobacteraceae bacterium]|nr:succinate dehydrogenase, cytochrome b556 subunit [Rhodanobacteraceae bacterium]